MTFLFEHKKNPIKMHQSNMSTFYSIPMMVLVSGLYCNTFSIDNVLVRRFRGYSWYRWCPNIFILAYLFYRHTKM